MAAATAELSPYTTEKGTCIVGDCNRHPLARVDWVMSPSLGDALFCCALKKAGGYRTNGKTPGRQNRELLVIALACF
ncbi:hypothetical protein HV334_08600 [Citrobacter sp. RHBSTW-00944]|nr:hypothetical protein HV334_08600 [Citrobacter sp. RHBSTW-00944]